MSKVTYVGLDVHLNSIAAVWGRPQEKPRTRIVPNTEEGWRALVEAIGILEVWGVYEASSCGFEVYDAFSAMGWRMSVVAPTHMAKSVKGKKGKTDLRDARELWGHLMSHGELGTDLATIWIPKQELREERELTRRRLDLSEHLCRAKNRILSLLRIHKIKRPAEMKSAWTQKHKAWLRGLSSGSAVGMYVRMALASRLRELEFVEQEIEAIQQAVEALAATPRYSTPVQKMIQIDGVGILTAMVYLVELGDMRRFSNRGQIGSYLGLVPMTYESGEANNRKGHITRMGPARVRKVLNQAAWTLVRRDPHWQKQYQDLAQRGGAKVAITAISRKLGIVLWHKALSA